MARTKKTPTSVLPNGRYRPATAARLMGIARCTLYKYINSGKVKSDFTVEDGVPSHFIKGIEIIKFNENAIYTC